MQKENILAGILSFIIPGLGQLYQQRNPDAIWFFLAWIVSALFCITLPITLIIWVWAIYDALVYKSNIHVE